MSAYFKFWLLWALTGSPVTALIILLALGALADWYSVGFLRRGYRLFINFRRGQRLAVEIQVNPANRKARFDLGDILIEQRRFVRAIEVLKPVLEADPDDIPSLYLLGIACLGAGRFEQGELFLETVERLRPDHRQGGVALELGRFRLARGEASRAVEPLQRYLQSHPSSVEAHCLLARAFESCGDRAKGHAERERAWHEYATSPAFQRRADRFWAWRAKPSRPAVFALLFLIGIFAAGLAVHRVDLSSVRNSVSEQPDEER